MCTLPGLLQFIREGDSILVVGDGSFTFSRELRRLAIAGKLVATSLDSLETLHRKYGEDAIRETLSEIESGEDCSVLHGVDAMRMCIQESVLQHGKFDCIIFMHPLIGADSKPDYRNRGTAASGITYMVSNKYLLHCYLRCAHCLLVPGGKALITLKQVYPYSWWRTASLADSIVGLNFQTAVPHCQDEFPGYDTVNVDHGHSVKQTGATVFVFEKNERQVGTAERQTNACEFCDVSDITSAHDYESHCRSKKHGIRRELELAWRAHVRKDQECACGGTRLQ